MKSIEQTEKAVIWRCHCKCQKIYLFSMKSSFSYFYFLYLCLDLSLLLMKSVVECCWLVTLLLWFHYLCHCFPLYIHWKS